MANHDFNKPCDCRECREVARTICCPSCGRSSVLVSDRTPEWDTDRKGVTGVSFKSPEDKDETFECICGFIIQKVGYYTYFDEIATRDLRKHQQQREAAAKCGRCGAAEGVDQTRRFLELVTLKEHHGQCLCQNCLADQIEVETPDPSNDTEKYIFNKQSMKWVLKKVKRPCRKCNTQRWLNAENSWKNLCKECYKKQFE